MMRRATPSSRRPSGRPRRPVLPPLLLVLAVTAVPGCRTESAAPAAPPAVPVTIAAVSRQSVPVQVKAIGSVEAFSTVAVKPQVTGEITGVHFTEGQDVKQGQLLFTLDPRPFQADLERARATLVQDEARARFAQAQAARYNKLNEEGVAAREQADQYQTGYEALLATVNADRAAVEYAEVQLTYTRIESPVDGRTGNLNIHLGNVVKANPDEPLVTIHQIEPTYVAFAVPQQRLPEIQKYAGQGSLQVQALIPGQEDRPETGQLSFIDNAVDLATGTILLKGTFPNEDRRLWPGQFVNVVLTLTRQPDTLVVPSRAILTGQEGTYVFVVGPDMTVESRPVREGPSLDGLTVVAGGLEAGEQVVTDGQIRLVPGSRVEVKEAGTMSEKSAP